MAFIIGTPDSDTLNGTADNDFLSGLAGNDYLYGNGGDDFLNGGEGADRLFGGTGSDTAIYTGSAVAGAYFVASLYNSNVNTDAAIGDYYSSIENLSGTSSNDRLYGNNSDNTLWGNSGNDFLHGGGGADSLIGGSGSDTADYSGSLAASGTFVASLYNSNVNTDDAVGDTYDSIENLSGTQYQDILYGNNSDNTLWGNVGNDTLYGLDGDDFLNGGAGADRLYGGAGFDTADYSGSSAASGTFVASLYNSSVNTDYAIGDIYSSIENLAGTSFNDILYGNNSSNTLWGNDGADTLYGLNGNDTLNGGAGADRLYGGAGSDTADYSGSSVAGSYFVASLYNSNVNTDDAIGDIYSSIENLSGTSFDDRLYGNNSTNTLWGNNGDDFLNGGAGADHLYGGSGSDTADYSGSAVAGSYFVASLYNSNVNTDHAVGDIYDSIENLSGTSFNDILYGNNSSNTLWGNNGTDFLYGLDGDDTLYGDAGGDRLRGGTGDDSLYGGDGGDFLYGGTGNDDLYGGAEADTFVFEANDGADWIHDFQNGQDKIDFSAIDGLGYDDITVSLYFTPIDGFYHNLIEYGSGTIVLDGILGSQIDESDFIFEMGISG